MMCRIFAMLLLIACSGVFAGHLGFLYPGGARAGETVEVLAGGQGNWGVKGVHVDGAPGVRCIRIDNAANIPYFYNTQRKYLQDAVRCLREHKSLPPLPEKRDEWRKFAWGDRLETLSPLQMDILLRGLYTRPNPLQISPSIGQKIILHIEVAPDARPGVRFLRLCGPGIISNPVPFFIGTAPETAEPRYTPPYEKRVDPVVTMPASINGQILPGETDTFRVRLNKETQYYFKLYGRFFKPYIGDGVPGFFQPVVELRDLTGKLIALADRDGLEPDPLMVTAVPADGEYLLKIRDALYRGREDFVYRIECGTGAFPRPALPDRLPPLPRRDYKDGMTADSPVLILGELPAGTRHTIRFNGRKGEKKVFQTFARKIGSMLDAVLHLYGPDGKLIAEYDDSTPEVLVGRGMHFADACGMAELPADGCYTLSLSDRAGASGRYALRIDRPRPDFQLVCAPSGLECAMNADTPVEVFLRRIEGFSGPVRLMLTGPKTLSLRGAAEIPPGVDHLFVTVWAHNMRRPTNPEPVKLIGTAATAEGKLRHEAVAADPAMQAFAYTHYVEAPVLLAAARWRSSGTVVMKTLPGMLKGKPGETVRLRYQIQYLQNDPAFQMPEILDPPAWLTAGKVRVLRFDRRKRMHELEIPLTFSKDAPAGKQRTVVLHLPITYKYKTKNNEPRTGKGIIMLPALPVETERNRK